MKTWWHKDVDKFYTPSVQSHNVAGGDQYINSPVVPPSLSVSIDQESIKEYLQSKGCVLWMNWNITSESGLEEASEWLSNEVLNLVVFCANKNIEDGNTK